MKLMLAELHKDKEVLIKKREDLKAIYKSMPDDEEYQQQKQNAYMKIRKIETDLQTEYFKIIEDKEDNEPSVMKPKAPLLSKKYLEEKEALRKSNKLKQDLMRRESQAIER